MAEDDLVTVVVGHCEPLVRRGLLETLREHRRVRVLATDRQDAALELNVKRAMPSVVILDEAADHALIMRLRSRQPTIAVFVLVHDPPRLYQSILMAAGASCLPLSSSAEQITTAVLLAGRRANARRPKRGSDAEEAPSIGHVPTQHQIGLLTRREIDVLGYLIRGLPYAEIAVALHLAEATIKTHSERIRHKLGVKSRRELLDLQLPPGVIPTA